ncbi:MAG: hypothetical protein QNJ31_00155 [Candidatus Caenarcaniphilales bacterium]|nr:hypothetical protein [Candidatus Caenarcaniphilales bacterium]
MQDKLNSEKESMHIESLAGNLLYRDYNPNNSSETLIIERNIKEVFDFIETTINNHKNQFSICRTIFDLDYILEIEFQNKYLRFTFDSEQLLLPKSDDNVDAIIQLNYTGEDIKPIRGKVIDSRKFQGIVDKLYLLDDAWYLLNPKEFCKIMPLEDFILSTYTLNNRILADVFDA